MTLYDVLGVRPSATASEVRIAYLAAARRAHPDVAGPAGEDTMREVNAAWAVLGDADRRAQYDLTLAAGPSRGNAGTGTGTATSKGPGTVRLNRREEAPFVPYHEHDEDDDDTWRYTDDPVDPATAPGAWLQIAPVIVVAVGLVITVVGGFVGGVPAALLGLAIVAMGAVGFIVVPMAVMAKASEAERRRTKERGR